jgi:hypothetical protein
MCWYCGSAVLDAEPIGRSTRCPDCGKDLRSCRSCRFYLPGGRGDCAEAQSELVADKERGNFCDWFSLNPLFRTPTEGESKSRGAATRARESFDSLFGS